MKMKANEVRKMSAAELETKLVELKKDLFNLRLQHAVNQPAELLVEQLTLLNIYAFAVVLKGADFITCIHEHMKVAADGIAGGLESIVAIQPGDYL